MRGAESQRGQSTVEWVGLLAFVALLFLALVATGIRVPGTALAAALAERIACAVADPGGCGESEPALIAAYGTDVGRLARRHMPTLAFEEGSRALPVDFRLCRSPECSDGGEEGPIERSEAGHPVTAFVHVVDCRDGGSDTTEAAAPAVGADCSGSRDGNLYLQYWLYYPDSATLRGVPIAGSRGYHRDDWESVQVRVAADGRTSTRASSHHGYNHTGGLVNWSSDMGVDSVRDVSEFLGARPDNGWGPATGYLRVSGGSHAGNIDFHSGSRFTPAPRVHLVPLESVAESDRSAFAVSPPWLKDVWTDPEAEGTD